MKSRRISSLSFRSVLQYLILPTDRLKPSIAAAILAYLQFLQFSTLPEMLPAEEESESESQYRAQCETFSSILFNSGLAITVLSTAAVLLNLGILAVYWKARRLLTPQYLAVLNVVVGNSRS